jgi:hypothetical protein
MAGDTAYDLIVPLLIDLNTMPHLDFSQPWWETRAAEQFGIGDKLYFMVGDLNAVDNGVTFCIIFNKDLVTELKIGNPYELVRSNQWTMDKFTELSAAAVYDINDDSIFNEHDRWGFISETYTTYILSVGGGFRVWSSVMTVPTTNTDLERTGIMLEAMAAESMYTLTPAFYDITLATKALRDAESEETLSMILASRAYDIGEIYDWGGTSAIFYSDSREFASAYARIEQAVETAMEKTLTLYREAV